MYIICIDIYIYMNNTYYYLSILKVNRTPHFETQRLQYCSSRILSAQNRLPLFAARTEALVKACESSEDGGEQHRRGRSIFPKTMSHTVG